jgi:hypothetical protein
VNRRELLRAMVYGVPLMTVSQELADLLSPKRTIFLPPRLPVMYPTFTAYGAVPYDEWEDSGLSIMGVQLYFHRVVV